MRRTLMLLAGVLLSVLALGSDSPKEYDNKTEIVGIEGTWRLTECTFNGRKITSGNRQMVMTLHSGTVTFKHDDGHTSRGKYRIDSVRKLPQFDRDRSSAPFPCYPTTCIYQIDGEVLWIAGLAGAVDERPQGFNDEGVLVETYKRVK